MDSTHSKLVSTGVLGSEGHAALPVPQNIDLGEHSVVDVSVQRFDGSSDHPGDSLVGGPFFRLSPRGGTTVGRWAGGSSHEA
ncbi:anti-sigma factor [Streptomyces sp. NPDC048512]|uniref:anti-sigma factor n=1 Tax=unclassified Streptomyces TaxID=2593676 RepID=UPI0009BDF85D|nr:anti-sigma factor [Streptomyces sp. M41(2017)]OQQ13889.1 hypothetical protein B0675_27135 [Streptomyces sp. M41(2017)]